VNQITVGLALSGTFQAKSQDCAALVEKYRSFFPILATDSQKVRLEAILTGSGVGSQLWRLLTELGIEHKPSCSCLDWAERMNAWGPKGCRLARPEIVRHMKDSAKNYGWSDVGKAVAKAIASGLALRLSVLDPYGSLLDEAIRRANTVE